MILNDDTQNFLVGLCKCLSSSLEWWCRGFLSPVWKKMDDKKVAWKGPSCSWKRTAATFRLRPTARQELKKSTEGALVASKIVFIFSIGHSTRLSIITGRGPSHLLWIGIQAFEVWNKWEFLRIQSDSSSTLYWVKFCSKCLITTLRLTSILYQNSIFCPKIH